MKIFNTLQAPASCLLLACLLSLVACGQRGPLYLPEDKQSPPQEQVDDSDDGNTAEKDTAEDEQSP